MDALLAAWALWPPAVRETVLRVDDPDVVRGIDLNMRMLWTADMQGQRFKVKGAVDPFDSKRFPLLSSMRCGDTGSIHPGRDRVKWPQDYYEDAMLLPSAIRAAQGVKLVASRTLSSHEWPQLLQPPAKSWLAFEHQLSLLVEQLVLHAREEANATAVVSQHAVAPLAVQLQQQHVGSQQPQQTIVSALAVAEQGPVRSVADSVGKMAVNIQMDKAENVETAVDPDDDPEFPDDHPGAAFSTARAAKRSRQRERRKMGKVQRPVDTSNVAEGMSTDRASPTIEPTPMPATLSVPLRGIPLTEPPTSTSGCGNIFEVQPCSSLYTPPSLAFSVAAAAAAAEPVRIEAAELVTEAATGIKADTRVLSIVRAEVEQLSLQLSGLYASARPAPPAKVAPPSSRKSKAAPAPSGAAAAAAAPASAAARRDDARAGGSTQNEEEDDSTSGVGMPSLAGFDGANARQGVGRGRPIAGHQRRLDGLTPQGRGRALEPPPGLQGSSQRLPGLQMPVSLAPTWVAPPGIPEDDEDRDPDVMDSFWLPPGAAPSMENVSGYEMTGYESLGSSPFLGYASSPLLTATPADSMVFPWCHTPSDPGTPKSRCRTASTAAVGPAFIPTYVTVPVALAHECPHCGCQFAWPSGIDSQADPTRVE
jgi:hypothetical protein